MINVEQTIISQYANSDAIVKLIHGMNDCIDPATDFDNFYDFVWNVQTAKGFGLDIWGKIVVVSRYLKIAQHSPYLGFSEGSATAYYPFNYGYFWDGGDDTGTYKLADDAYRTLILAKALRNISASDAKTANTLLVNLFAGRGRCYVNDLGNMQMRYTFEFTLTPYEYAIITQSGVLPRPAGVTAYALQIPSGGCFGFSEAGGIALPFDYGVFLPEGYFTNATV